MSLCVILLREQSELWFFTPRMTKMLGGLSPLVVKFGGAAAPRAPLLPTPVLETSCRKWDCNGVNCSMPYSYTYSLASRLHFPGFFLLCEKKCCGVEPRYVERGGGLHVSLRDPRGMRILPNCKIEWRISARDQLKSF